jgi:tRNA threonylcarbamoyl adenosine modification protein YeaZ
MRITQLEKKTSFSPKNASLCYGLGIDTTGAVLTLAVGAAQSEPRCQVWVLERELSAQLHPLLGNFLQSYPWQNCAWIAVMKGPGSFTGTRLGVVTARMLAHQLQLPLFGFSNLAMTAWLTAPRNGTEATTIAVSQPGQRGYLYGAVYAVHPQTKTITALQADQLWLIADWEQHLNHGQPKIDHYVQQDNLSLKTPNPDLGPALLTLGWQIWQNGVRPHWSEILPYYG